MKLNEKHNKHRKFLKRYKKLYAEQGKIQAAIEFDKRIDEISKEYQLMFEQLKITHQQQIKSLTKKEREFEILCQDEKSKIEKINESLVNIRLYEAEGLQHSKNLYAMLQDEKVKKYMALNHDTDMIKQVLNLAEKESAKVQ